jgi:hypothetical protein
MFEELNLNLQHGNAICYSGYREGQNPGLRVYPSYEEIREDLLILAKNWQFLRLYDCSRHAELVLEVISNESLHFKVMLEPALPVGRRVQRSGSRRKSRS